MKKRLVGGGEGQKVRGSRVGGSEPDPPELGKPVAIERL